METKDTQSRKWLLTINNPQDYELDTNGIIDRLQRSNPHYFCFASEIATTGTPHMHIYIFSHNPIRFSTLKNRFPTAHIEKAQGTSTEIRDYIRKEGKWAESVKAETRIEGSFFEFGTVPTPAEEKAPKMYRLLEDIKDGVSTAAIIDDNPNLAFKGRAIDELRETLLNERFRIENRNVEVFYLFGATRTGKTKSIFQKHSAADICRVTNYGGCNGVRFDSYRGQPILVFEEFRSQIPISAMLNYLDIYPIMLPARYNDRVACYHTIYITSNRKLEDQYQTVQEEEPETWKAFLRRIHHVIEFRQDGTVHEHGETSDLSPQQIDMLEDIFSERSSE